MFEKSLLDLIRGLRLHKGNEKAYIQNCLKECRAEVRSQDMDVKATALLKLVYLEMVGHDMSWASFHVLEVMSSQKLHQKRIGYLAAVQSFRADTEVLMLATNLLKKDLSATSPITIQLPIATLPHVITPSLALSVLPDLLPRLTHSHRVIRKKTIVTLYRMALVYPETLRAAWPKIKDRLMDPTEDPSVTAAIINVICELGWRRPHDFLPLAPRLFELLVDGHNNWMSIKLIKLFATLTPLEPRLVRKLLPPLTDIIRTTPAMSLLYECINGIIQGGILGSDDDASGREEIALLCVTKLRDMMMLENDTNLKYVALLAFNKIVATHPYLVAQQEDVILGCLDSPDISIRIQTLDLVQGLVSSDNLMTIVGRLMRQLKQSTLAAPTEPVAVQQIEFRAESDDEEGGGGGEGGAAARRSRARKTAAAAADLPLPEDYKIDVIQRILAMCAQNNYGNLVDFDWYVDILTQLLRTAPAPGSDGAGGGGGAGGGSGGDGDGGSEALGALSGSAAAAGISEKIGNELRNVAVKVHALRPAAVRAADEVIGQLSREAAAAAAAGAPVASTALKPLAWMAGEYAAWLPSAGATLACLLQLLPRLRYGEVLATCVQAAGKLFAHEARGFGAAGEAWTAEAKTRAALLVARVVHALEPLGRHPQLEVQERAVELSELLKLAAEAVAAQPASTADVQQDAPLLLTEAIPALFGEEGGPSAGSGGGLDRWTLNSVAAGAQRSVPVPSGLDLDEPIHANLGALLAAADDAAAVAAGDGAAAATAAEEEFDAYYWQRPAPTQVSSDQQPAIQRLQQHAGGGDAVPSSSSSSYQQQQQPPRDDEESYLDADILARRRAERQERHRDDPFYIQPGGAGAGTASASTSTPIHDILQTENGQDLDIDAIPVMPLDLSSAAAATNKAAAPPAPPAPRPRLRPQIVVAADEVLGGGAGGGGSGSGSGSGRSTPRHAPDDSDHSGGRGGRRAKKALLQVDSSHLGALVRLEDGPAAATAATAATRPSGLALDLERQRRADAEMAQALKEVEKRRLAMQRANERVQLAQGVPAEGAAVVVTKKKKKKKTAAAAAGGPAEGEPGGEAPGVKKKKKAKKVVAVE